MIRLSNSLSQNPPVVYMLQQPMVDMNWCFYAWMMKQSLLLHNFCQIIFHLT